jgi:UDP-N-acetylglucosamine 2-epimerase (hydrolysing)
MKRRRIAFLTGTRADFGKLKSLIEKTLKSEKFEVLIFATGMHMHMRYGSTVDEIVKCGYPNIYGYINYTNEETMDLTLAKTIEGFSNYVKEFKPDLIVVHGDRTEALAGAIVGALNNILVAHIEGGEVSGTVDELMRHSISKMSHSHFVANSRAKQRLIQMGEDPKTVFLIGSPDVDVMLSKNLPSIKKVKEHYEIDFADYALLIFHPVTPDAANLQRYCKDLVDAVLQSEFNFVVIYPNNDLGASHIIREYERFAGNPRFKTFPSIRFENFVVLLKNAQFLLGNSSAGIREAPYFGLPVINIGDRQRNRSDHADIINCDYANSSISEAFKRITVVKCVAKKLFGDGNSNKLFLEVIGNEDFWRINKQKIFKDLPNVESD